MPSYAQLDDEAAWRAETAAPGIATLAAGLRAHYAGAEIGIRGDNNHLNGYHRSRRWIKESAFCTNRTYSVSRTAGDKSGGDSNWACAIDFGGIPQAELHQVCKRLDAAVRAGRLEKITEWYGNFGDDDRVDGFDNISNRMASSDSSHLFHLHMSFDRGRANEDHSDLLAILIGDDMSWTENLTAGPDGNFATFPAKDWMIGTNIAVWNKIIPALGAISTVLDAVAKKVDLDDSELAALKQAAEAGAKAGAIASAGQLAAAVADALKDELGLTEAEAEAAAERALRRVLGTLDAPATPQG